MLQESLRGSKRSLSLSLSLSRFLIFADVNRRKNERGKKKKTRRLGVFFFGNAFRVQQSTFFQLRLRPGLESPLALGFVPNSNSLSLQRRKTLLLSPLPRARARRKR